jgi:hypothetical protein
VLSQRRANDSKKGPRTDSTKRRTAKLEQSALDAFKLLANTAAPHTGTPASTNKRKLPTLPQLEPQAQVQPQMPTQSQSQTQPQLQPQMQMQQMQIQQMQQQIQQIQMEQQFLEQQFLLQQTELAIAPPIAHVKRQRFAEF